MTAAIATWSRSHHSTKYMSTGLCCCAVGLTLWAAHQHRSAPPSISLQERSTLSSFRATQERGVCACVCVLVVSASRNSAKTDVTPTRLFEIQPSSLNDQQLDHEKAAIQQTFEVTFSAVLPSRLSDVVLSRLSAVSSQCYCVVSSQLSRREIVGGFGPFKGANPLISGRRFNL
jgi:hypothetical protein